MSVLALFLLLTALIVFALIVFALIVFALRAFFVVTRAHLIALGLALFMGFVLAQHFTTASVGH